MGQGHCKRVVEKVPEMKLAAVCDAHAPTAEKVGAELKVPHFTAYRDMIAANCCDAVIVATPHPLHPEISIACMEAGLHVLTEKPVSERIGTAEEMVKTAERKGVTLGVIFQQRFAGPHRKAIELMKSGVLGPVHRVTALIPDYRTQAYYNAGGWRATWAGEGGGVLLNQCPHNLDLWQWMFGMPERVRGFCKLGRKHTIEVEDEVTAYMEYKGGCTGVFITSTGEAPGTNRLEVAGENGKLVYENGQIKFTRNEVSANTFLKTSKEAFSCPATWNIEIPTSGGYGGQHAEILQNFIDAIVSGKPLIAPAVEGIHSVELGNAMIYSSETGKTVELPLDGKAYERMLKQKIRTSKFVKKTRKVDQWDLSKSVK
jgi:predicted dehydrogenase